ncbi:hypothetical protein BOTNAR_0028g00230 [Botryotinia narcissicola]|uniref:Uncharacterized protein n=1 Tax=Botryotinia narcissicola TaxID=278944 RepID=A0A4Z1J9J9_9HELO|nr:hypothetical protein BOTNAR_0028g00230 [Botryotinia narcissicola]
MAPPNTTATKSGYCDALDSVSGASTPSRMSARIARLRICLAVWKREYRFCFSASTCMLMHDFFALEMRYSDGGKPGEVEDLACVSGLTDELDFEGEVALTGDVGGHGSGVEGLTDVLHVEMVEAVIRACEMSEESLRNAWSGSRRVETGMMERILAGWRNLSPSCW